MYFIPNIQCFEEFFSKTDLFLKKKNSVFPKFQWIQSVFCSIEIVFKILMESLSVLINQNCCFDQSNVKNKVFKKFKFDLFKPLFQKLFKTFSLSPTRQAPQQFFCRFPPNFLQGFSLNKPICPYYPFFCIVFYVFVHYFRVFG